MSTIPLPALDVKVPTPRDPLAEFGRVAQLQGSLQEQQLRAQDIHIKQQQAQDLQATTQAMNEWDPRSQDYNDLTQLALKHGASANGATALQQHGIQVQQLAANLNESQRKAFKEKHQALADALQPLTDPTIVPDEQLHPRALDLVMSQVHAGNLTNEEAQPLIAGIQQTSDPATLRNLINQKSKTDMGMAGIMAQHKETAQTQEAESKSREANATAAIKEIEAKGLQGITPDYINQTAQDPVTKQQALAALQRGDVMGAKDALKAGFQSALEVQKSVTEATNPAIQAAKLHLATATKAAEQAIADGDPKAAAKLLVDGTVAPSQLVSSRKPAFAQAAFTEASHLQPGWSATKADADYKVASSPAQVAFFGSAKSLTDKGGTLDQLEAAAKDIPDGQIPIFNSLADAYRAATGSGPVAKYASILVGVSDDYSKVMGGGQGSDSSRTQALHLAPTNASPEARHAAVEGIRGAVGSQIKSRIGNNAVLQKMYGEEEAAPVNDFFSQFGGKAK